MEPVLNVHRGIQCDKCDFWFHAGCVNLDGNLYSQHVSSDSSRWFCPSCQDKETSGTSSDSDEDTSDEESNLEASSSTQDKSTRVIQHPKKNKLRILLINYQSVKGKAADVAALIEMYQPDIVCGTETWLNKNISSSEIFPDSYVIFRRDRTMFEGGGVIHAVKKNLVASQIQDPADCELVWTEIQVKDRKPLIVGTFYRTKEDNEGHRVDELSSAVSRMGDKINTHHIIVTGDFNLPNVNWDNNSTSSRDGYSKKAADKLVKFSEDHGFSQLVTEPTRIQGDAESILDLVFSNNAPSVHKASVIAGVADHFVVLVDVNVTPTRKRRVKRKVFLRDKADVGEISRSLRDYLPEYKLETAEQSVECKWEKFHQKVHQIMDKCVPHKITTSRYNLPWFGRPLRRLCRKKQRLYNKAKASRMKGDWDNYHKFRKHVQRRLRSARTHYIKDTLEVAFQENPKVFWRYIKGLRKEDSGVADLLHDGKVISDSNAKAEILNQQFASVFTLEGTGDLPDLGVCRTQKISPLVISNEGVLKQLKDLNASKAQGPDEIPPWFLKLAAEEISPYLTDIFQTSVDTGKVPTMWKEANITPVFKKGSRAEASNYRPVSLTVVSCKILEHIISSHVMKHAEVNGILNNNQHGFRPRRSPETQLILTVDEIAKQLDKGKLVDMAILDFQKAFDKVPHRRLIHKLCHYGMSGQIANWVEDFLTGRSQRVMVEGKLSAKAPVLSGVPQGTVFGPIAFLFYINDLADNIQSSVRLFADDCLVYSPADQDSISTTLQYDLGTLEKWQDDWMMSFNPSKCVTMTIGMRNPPNHVYEFCGQQLETVESHPYLGVHFNNTLTWSDHITEVCKKAQRVLGLIRRNLWACNVQVKSAAYTTLVRPLLEYATTAWDSSNLTNSSRLNRVQRQAARFCKREYSREEGTVTRILNELEWEPLEDRREIKKVTMFYKISQGLVDIVASDHLVQQYNKGTRGHNQKYRQIRYRTSRYGDTFFPSTIPIWNNLSPSAVNATTPEGFKEALKRRET